MSRANPFLLSRPRRAEIRRTFVVEQDGTRMAFPFCVRALEPMDEFNVSSIGRELVADYVTPHDKHTGAPKVMLPPVDGEPLRVTESTCFFVAQFLVAQCGEKDTEYAPWNETEIFAMLANPTMLTKLAELSGDMAISEVAENSPLPVAGSQSSATALPSESDTQSY